MNAGRFKVLGMQTNDLELDGVEWASPGAGRPMGSAAPEVGPLSLLFLRGGRVSFVSHFCEVHPPHTCLCACTKSQDKI